MKTIYVFYEITFHLIKLIFREISEMHMQSQNKITKDIKFHILHIFEI